MNVPTNPIPGYWYSNFDGRLLQVRAILYMEGVARLVVIEDMGGDVTKVPLEDWLHINLTLHSPVNIEDTPSVDLWQR